MEGVLQHNQEDDEGDGRRNNSRASKTPRIGEERTLSSCFSGCEGEDSTAADKQRIVAQLPQAQIQTSAKESEQLRAECREYFLPRLQQQKVRWEEIPESLKVDKELVLLALCGPFDDEVNDLIRTKDIKTDWLKDPEIVVKLIKSSSENLEVSWEQLPDSTKRHRGVLHEAFRMDLMLSWDDIPEDLKHDEEIVSWALRSEVISLCWDDITDELKRDKEIACLALVKENLPLKAADVPWVDQDYILSMLQRRGIYWDRLPIEFRYDLQFALGLPDEVLKQEACGILDIFPNLVNDHGVWKRIITCGDDDLHEIVDRYAPDSVRSDRELMMVAFSKDRRTLRYVDHHLIGDPDFFGHILDEDPSALEYLDSNQIIPHTDLITQRLPSIRKKMLAEPECYRKGCRCPLKQDVFAANHQFLEAWLLAGLPYPLPPVPRGRLISRRKATETDREICLLIAKHGDPSHRLASFDIASIFFHKDEVFMRQAIQYDPALVVCAEGSLQWDYELRLKALGGSRECFDRCMQGPYILYTYDSQKKKFFQKQQREMERKVCRELSFLDLFLRVIHDSDSVLSMLQPTELKRKIALYSNIPIGERLQLLLQAKKNFRDWSDEPFPTDVTVMWEPN